ncbi:MAG: L-aspartate oxidase [Thermodesulfovibrionales bacterium]|nr:L-aspartate oxidase [Thermodesulfovibrionales bacterium]
MQSIDTDFLVVGSGVAGLRAVIELAKYGNVHVITKDVPTESSSEYAQGGVAVAMSDEDEVGIHFEDTIKAGDGLCNEEAVRVLVKEGPDRIIELIDWGAQFDKKDSSLSFTLEAAHSRKRILHARGDSTGQEIMRVLIEKVKSLKNVFKISFCTAIDLLVDEDGCYGVLAVSKNELLFIKARAVIISTGGACQIYSRTTNPEVATGDGMAMAYRAGAILEDMEFVQFHPTVLYSPSAPQFLLSEAMRGEGATLRDINKEAFMSQYHPKAELAPRDVVARAIVSQMVNTKAKHVYLDLTHLDANFVKNRFPRIYSTCLQYDVDITKDMIPVSPGAHYFMGGIKTDLDGATNIHRLFAAGEVACTGVHGANRLASNSLLEGLVYGYRAALRAGNINQHHKSKKLDISSDAFSYYDSAKIMEIRSKLKRIMWEYVGLIRCSKSLNEALESLSQLSDLASFNFMQRQGIELRNMIIVSNLVVKSALMREGSVGAHYRSDFKNRGENWKFHISQKIDK